MNVRVIKKVESRIPEENDAFHMAGDIRGQSGMRGQEQTGAWNLC
jgi:hypothetical protein